MAHSKAMARSALLMTVDMYGRLRVEKSAMPRLFAHYRKQIQAAGKLGDMLRYLKGRK